MTIPARTLNLGISPALLLQLGRKISHNPRLKSLDHLASQDRQTLLDVLNWASLHDVLMLVYGRIPHGGGELKQFRLPAA